MSASNAVKQFAEMKVCQICEEWKDKELPNWCKFEDSYFWSFRINEGDLNFQISSALYKVEEVGAGNFLVKLGACIITTPVVRAGYEIGPVPLKVIEIDFQLFAEHEQDLQNGLLQLINDEAGNILCQLLDDA